MTGRDLILAMNRIDERFVQEAGSVRYLHFSLWKYASVAAGLIIVAASCCGILFHRFAQTEHMPEMAVSTPVEASPSTVSSPTANINDAAIVISMRSIHINEVEGMTPADYDRNVELYDEVTWNADDILTYYGKDLTPAYIPAGLAVGEENDTTNVWVGIAGTAAEGTVGMDTVTLTFQDDTGIERLSVSVSSVGFPDDIYVLDNAQESTISDVSVIFSHVSTADELYFAEFAYDGLQYRIRAVQLPLEELVRVVSSVVMGTDEIEIGA